MKAAQPTPQMVELPPTLMGANGDYESARHAQSMARLVAAVQELSLARDLNDIMAVVRRAARELTHADGATFVLMENDQCYYAEENAIAPLWKGQRFPQSACVSGWVMRNGRAAVIEDIYSDPRVPADAYRPTFVQSLVLVPIRIKEPIGAIGNYWAKRRMPAPREVELLQTLANTTAVAMENVQLYELLEQRVKERTAQLEAANRELEAYDYAVSHDLAAPLRSIRSFAQILVEESGCDLPPQARGYLDRIERSAGQMRGMIDSLLRLSKISHGELDRQQVNLSEMAQAILARLASENHGRVVEVQVAEGLEAWADPGLAQVLLQNLLGNAWKYSAGRAPARIEFGSCQHPNGSRAFLVRDNGAGFDMSNAGRLFQPFRRLHDQKEFPGSGVGLVTVQRIVQRHGGRIWGEGAVGKGATFYFTLA